MSVKYTKEQEQVIYTRGRNLLVSAAAGSGKTAVLVERIIQIITDIESPVAIDELLIVTFTNAAASEMADRISLAIENKINDVDNDRIMNHLIEQLTLMSSANIMTLHSFCLSILKNYYHLIDLDPKFRIGNETELILLREEVLDNMLETYYETANEGFVDLIECYAYGKDDQGIRDLILQLHRFSRSYPWPEQWMEESLEKIQFEKMEDIYNSPYMKVLLNYIKDRLQQSKELFESLRDLMELNEGPTKYLDTIESLKELFEEVEEAFSAEEYTTIPDIIEKIQIPPLSRKRKGFDVELAAEAKGYIDTLRDWVKELEIVVVDKKTVFEEMELIHYRVYMLTQLTQAFGEKFAIAKAEKNLIDFSDIEHFALNILYEQGEEKLQFSEVAKTYKETFVEVLVDEYQDINEVQESILRAVSKQMEPMNNLFMVGDLKQSIYKFRLAKPEIFRSKYAQFTYEESDNVKIDLGKNFRSRNEVLDFTNLIFDKVMSLEIGDVNYDDKAKLYLGANYYVESEFKASETNYTPEILVIEHHSKSETRFVKQAKVIGSKIRKIIDEQLPVYDKSIGDKGGERPVSYKDICILLRSPSSTIGDIKEVFEAQKIPYVSDQSKGYFDAIEVQLVLNILRVIDNPYFEVALISTLRSPWIGLNENQLLDIRGYLPEVNFYEALKAYSEASFDDQDEFIEKIKDFLTIIQDLRVIAKVKPISELIRAVYDITGYKYIVGYMSGGKQRVTNLEFLEMMARQYENTSYSGLFNFLRYIKHIEKYEVEIPEPLSDYEANDAVTIMSIHKSKGLEFPVVFIMDIGKQFNMTDLKASVLLHQELGIGSDYINPDERYKQDTFITKAMRLQGQYEIISEEMRLFYVALTRAREKLYLVCTTKDLEKVSEDISTNRKFLNCDVDMNLIKKAKSYYDFISLSCSDFESEQYIYEFITEEHVSVDQAFEVLTEEESYLNLLDLIQAPFELDEEDELYLKLMGMFEPYEHQDSVSKFVSLSVSELKRSHMEETDFLDLSERNFDKVIPEFIEKKEQKGAYYGTLIHAILAHLSIKEDHTLESIQSEISEMVNNGLITEEDGSSVLIKPLLNWTKSKLYKRVIGAYKKNHLLLEKPFVMKVEELGDLQMVQGVIDGYFYEGDEIVLYDYKTDRHVTEEELRIRYKYQLDYYKKALESITECRVKEMYIYSLHLNKEIKINE